MSTQRTDPRDTTATDPVRREIPAEAADRDSNPDPITGAPGSHPAGVGIGAASGAATGALAGSLGGPIGTVIGGVSGAIVGGLIGKGIGEAVDPSEDAYWRDTYANRPYSRQDYGYEDYEPAYRLGYNASSAYEGRDFIEVEPELQSEYDRRRGASRLDWSDARHAARDAYTRRSERRAGVSRGTGPLTT